ncbi:hypothetical protein SeMB42_g02902 [Synchytrium endobioticum]|uniref:Uncharacterized protein n=1 Tax=Synchytrium endobioticum TaxID=286115 RepID=A0A507DAR4_9FUNG|nr:hypothetical protein SeLEV6574_g06125 [Synchytrium endobioticum]TPX48663.1 hypothetical protein SeMB42_g02902 [Synchytrium endobioticum]
MAAFAGYDFEASDCNNNDTTSLSTDWNPSSFAIDPIGLESVNVAASKSLSTSRNRSTPPYVHSNHGVSRQIRAGIPPVATNEVHQPPCLQHNISHSQQLDLPSLRITKADVREQLRELGYGDADLPDPVIEEFMNDLKELYHREVKDGILANIEFDLTSSTSYMSDANKRVTPHAGSATSSRIESNQQPQYHSFEPRNDRQNSSDNGTNNPQHFQSMDPPTDSCIKNGVGVNKSHQEQRPEDFLKIEKELLDHASYVQNTAPSRSVSAGVPSAAHAPAAVEPSFTSTVFPSLAVVHSMTPPQPLVAAQPSSAPPSSTHLPPQPHPMEPVSLEHDENTEDANNGIDSIMRKLELMDLANVKKRVDEQKRSRLLQPDGGGLHEVSYTGHDWRRDLEQSLITLGEESILTPDVLPTRQLSAFSRYTARPSVPAKVKKHDPVALYHKHKSHWDSDPFLARLSGVTGPRPTSARMSFRSSGASR